MANTILLDITDDEATQNAFDEVSEGQTVEVTVQVLISEKSAKRIAGTIRMPVDEVRRMSSDIDDQNNANEQADLDEELEPESEIPGGVLRSMVNE
jgi:hypothetical protein|tara:strand:+ start:1160 stop:1447 length:288 start_codon:yes stop_codon:yes gene_type:complete